MIDVLHCVRFDHQSEVWELLKTSLPEFTLPELSSEPSIEAIQHPSLVSRLAVLCAG